MKILSALLWVGLVVLALAHPPGAMGQAGGVIMLDEPLNETELAQQHEQIRKMLEDPEQAQRAGLTRHDYCLTCRGGATHSCVSPFGGEVGKVFCSSECVYKCRGTCGVAPKGCS